MSNLNTTASLSNEMKTFYQQHFLDIMKPKLAYRMHAEESTVPKNRGRKIEWRDFKKFGLKTTPLTEGVVPEGNDMVIDAIEAKLEWYGDYVRLTDVLKTTSIDPLIADTVERFAIQAGESLDMVAGLEACSGTNVLFAGGALERGALTKASILTLQHIFRAAQFLKTNSAPTIDGSYFAVIHPDVVCQLYTYFNAAGVNPLIEVAKYTDTKSIVDGEIGKIGKIRFVESPNAITTTVDGNEGSLPVYQTLVYGKGHLGCAKLEGGNLESIIQPLGSGGTSDPLKQFSTIGWKATDACKLLNNDCCIRIESCVDLENLAV